MIHLYRFKDLNIVADVGSGAVHIVSDEAADFLCVGGNENGGDFMTCAESVCVAGNPDDENADARREALAEIGQLISDGTLFAPDTAGEFASPDTAGKPASPDTTAKSAPPDNMDESAPTDTTAKPASPVSRGAVVKAMCLHVAHDCNMRCAYCFADGGGFAGDRSLMPFETGKRAIDFLLENSGARKNLEIDFFGGEPLMNFGVVKELVAYGRAMDKKYGKHIRFTITTNGLLLDSEKETFINEHMDNVVLSIDGRPEVNDRIRKTVNGGGTYDLIIEKLRRLALARATAGKKYYVRGTYTAWNKDFTKDVLHLASLGFRNISVEPAVSDCGASWALTESDLPELLAEYERLADAIQEAESAGAPISFFHFNIDLSQGPCIYKRVAGCGAGMEYVAVTPNGDVYPCHQFAGDPEMRLGNVFDENPIERKDIPADFANAHVQVKEDCRVCWAKYYCSGGCHANALHLEGDLKKPHRLSCELEKKRVEVSIGLLAERMAKTSGHE